MTVSQILTFVNEVRPNAYSNVTKIQFLNEIEGEIFDFLIKFMPQSYEEMTNIEAITMEQALEEDDDDDDDEDTDDTDEDTTEDEGTTTVSDPLNLGTTTTLQPIYTLKPYTVSDMGATVLLADRFMGVYTSYIMAKIDHLASESIDYQNDALMHQAEMAAFQEWYTRTHMPKHPRIGGLA